jgi:hypothetical protein
VALAVLPRREAEAEPEGGREVAGPREADGIRDLLDPPVGGGQQLLCALTGARTARWSKGFAMESTQPAWKPATFCAISPSAVRRITGMVRVAADALRRWQVS